MLTKKTNYILFLIIFLSISSIFSTFFISIFFIGVVFEIFIISIEKKYPYTFLATIISFLFLEVLFGLPIFLLLLISLFTYYIIIPKIIHLFSSKLMEQLGYISIFYLTFFLAIFLINHYDYSSYKIFIYNFLIDSIIIGLFI